MDEERNSGGRWRRVAAGCVIALFVGAGCSLGGPGLSELQPGDCFSGQPHPYPPNIEAVECQEANPMTDYLVMFTEDAAGDTYPGNLDDIRSRCMGEAGFFVLPSSEEWDGGDRTVLCFTSALVMESE